MILVCMYGNTYIKSMDQTGKVANPTRSPEKMNTQVESKYVHLDTHHIVLYFFFGVPAWRLISVSL